MRKFTIIPHVAQRPTFVDWNPTLAAVIVESRMDSKVFDSIINARANLPSTTMIYIVTTKSMAQRFRYVFTKCQPCDILSNLMLVQSSRDTKHYSNLLLNIQFWNAFHEDYILIFQRDSRFCARSRRRVTDFLGKYDYIGAPWTPKYAIHGGYCVGNGGFFLRKRISMIWCIAQIRSSMDPEDVAFVKCMLKNDSYRLPTCTEAANFAVETYHVGTTPVGVHAARGYQTDLFMSTVCPEMFSSPR